MFGLPLKPIWGDMSTDWYVDQIPNALGIVYLDSGIWKAHFKEFPEGVYDTTVEYGRGYELSVFATSLFSISTRKMTSTGGSARCSRQRSSSTTGTT
jgi:hypothetical protein